MLDEHDSFPSLPHSPLPFCVYDLDECKSQWNFDLIFGKMRFVITIFPDGEHEIL